MNTQIKIKHHYIPKFHLKNWQGKNGQLLVYKKNGDGSIQCKGRHPSQVCFEKGLYSLGSDMFGAKILTPDYVENELSNIDNDASIVMDKILSNLSLSSLTDEDKNNWAIYIISLMNRIPDRIEANDKFVQQTFKEIFNEIRANGIPETQETYEQCSRIINNSDYLKNEARLILLSSCKDSEAINAFSAFSWLIFVTEKEFPYKFVLTDNPIVTFGDNDIILLALTPSMLWVALPGSFVGSPEFIDLSKYFVMMYNGAQIIRKPQFIISLVELKNDGLYRYDKIFSEFVELTVGPNAKT